MDFYTIKKAAEGHWLEILPALGISPDSLTGKHGPCPGCNGRDRFRFVSGDDGKWFCGQGGNTTGGDGFALLSHTGMSIREAFESVSHYLGIKHSHNQITQEWERIYRAEKLDKLIFHECHILMQITGNRFSSIQLEKDKNFQQARPEWKPMPKDFWEREILAAKRLLMALGEQYDQLRNR